MPTAEQFSELYRRYRPVKLVTTQFFTADASAHDQWMAEDLAKSGLTNIEMLSSSDGMEKLSGDAQAVYTISYWDIEGKQLKVMCRKRYKRPPFSKAQRYLQPNEEQLAAVGLPSTVPYIHPMIHLIDGSNVICCEGEKKTVAVMKYLNLPAFGIGGCKMWGAPNDKLKLHPWIIDLLRKRNATKLTIIPDGDVWRYDICASYGGFAHAAQEAGLEVSILIPDGKIDDLIVAGLRDLSTCETIGPDELVRSPDSLIDEFSLAFKQGPKSRIVHQNISNVHILMDQHPGFPPVWRNMDTNKVMLGEEEAEPGNTEIGIVRHFQHYFGMEKIGPQIVQSVMGEMALKDKRSPFLDEIKSVKWDGEKRLETWLQRLWGVEDSPHVREVGTKWLVSSCARQDKPGNYVAWMFIVIGAQATGKTSMPRVLFGDLAKLISGHMDDKDLKNLAHSGLCMNYDEMDSLGTWEMSKLKSMITNCVDSYRPPYAVSTADYPRRFVLYGCGNDSAFLKCDPTGQRRYGIVTVGRKLDFETLKREREQMWAEAWALYQEDGCDYGNLTYASEEARRYEKVDPKAELIQDWIMGVRMNPTGNGRFIKDGMIWIRTADVWTHIFKIDNIPGPNSAANKELANTLNSVFESITDKTARGPMGPGRYYRTPLVTNVTECN